MKIFPRQVFKNFISLSVLQLGNFIMPLITAPYIIRKIGIENYGLVNVSLALIVFFSIASDYGFNLSATREVSMWRDEKNKLSEIVSKVIATKFIILIVCFVVFTSLVFSVTSFREEWKLHLLSFSIVVGQAVFPFWFYQGIESVRYITVISLVSKVLNLLMVFVLIDEKSDYRYINVISGTTTFAGAGIALYLVFSVYKLKFIMPNFSHIIYELKKGSLILVSNLSNVAYSFLNIIVLNFMIKDKALVGSYSLAEKVISISKQVLIIYSQVIYPHMCKLMMSGFEEIRIFFLKSYIPFLILIAVGCCSLLFLSPWIIFLLSGSYDSKAIFILRILAPVPLIITLNIPFYQLLVIYDFKKSYSLILVSAALLNLLVNIIFIKYLSAIGCGFSMLITEGFITTGLFFEARRKYFKTAHFTTL